MSMMMMQRVMRIVSGVNLGVERVDLWEVQDRYPLEVGVLRKCTRLLHQNTAPSYMRVLTYSPLAPTFSNSSLHVLIARNCTRNEQVVTMDPYDHDSQTFPLQVTPSAQQCHHLPWAATQVALQYIVTSP